MNTFVFLVLWNDWRVYFVFVAAAGSPITHHVISLSLQVTMRITGKVFDCFRKYYETNQLLRRSAGNVDRYVEARPLDVPSRAMLEGFVRLLFLNRVCCFLTDSFVNYIVGNFTSAGAALLFVAKRAHCFIQNVIFQCEVFVPLYMLGKYELHATQYTLHDDVCIHLLGRNINITLIVFCV
jgi:hypothetical protein